MRKKLPRRRYDVFRENELWLGRQLGLRSNGFHHIDLSDDVLGVEVKTKNRENGRNWACADEEVREFPKQNPGKELYFAFLLYDLAWNGKPVDYLGRLIRNRETWMVPWGFVDNLPATKGTKRIYRYMHHYDLKSPELPEMRLVTRGNARFYVPKDSLLEERLSLPEKARVYTLIA